MAESDGRNKMPDLDGYSGAEIRQVAIEAAYNGGDLETASQFVISISRSQKAQMDALREWARARTIPASKPPGGRDQGQEEGAAMMVVTVSPETCEIEAREGFNLALPKFLWRVLEARAKALHDGDLEATMTELVPEELIEVVHGGEPGRHPGSGTLPQLKEATDVPLQRSGHRVHRRGLPGGGPQSFGV